MFCARKQALKTASASAVRFHFMSTQYSGEQYGARTECLVLIRLIRHAIISMIESSPMCRNIKTLFNFDPPVTPEEVRAASLQFVRKISGFSKVSKANEEAFLSAIDEVAAASTRLLHSLQTTAPPKNREEEAAKAKARAAERFGA